MKTKTKTVIKKVSTKKDGSPDNRHTPKKKKTLEEMEKIDRKLAGWNGDSEIYCG